jgi:hypothetical protein
MSHELADVLPDRLGVGRVLAQKPRRLGLQIFAADRQIG